MFKIIDRLISYGFVKLCKLFPSLYRRKGVREFFTKNYTSGLVAIGEQWTRHEAIGPEWIYVDIKDCDFPIEFNSKKILPFEDNSQKLIYSTHMIEHLEPQDLEKFMKECFRILKPGGYLRFEAPCAKTLIDAYKGKNPALVQHFRDEILKSPKFKLDNRYREEHIGILSVLSCYNEGGHIPVYVEKDVFDQKVNNLSLEELETWLQTLQTPEQKKTHGHNNIVYFKKLERLAKMNNARQCWEVDYGKTNIPYIHLNNVYRRHKDNIIEGPHRIDYSIYFEAQKS
jgi:ubiquinone/menaquinone biosynthesis C-methylase UbiE